MDVRKPNKSKKKGKNKGASKNSTKKPVEVEESKSENKLSLKQLEWMHQENKRKADRKGRIANTEALLEKSKQK